MKIRIILAAIAALFFASVATAKVHTGIEVKVQSVKQQQGNDEDVFVKVTYKNRTKEPAKLLRWYLPDSEGNLEEGIFTITRDGEPVDYLGPHYKRPAPVEGDYLILKANQKITYQVELSRAYDFSETGYYVIELNVKNMALFGPSKPHNGKAIDRPNALKSDASTSIYLTKVVEKKAKPCNPRKEDCGGGGTGDDISFTGACSNSEQNTIVSAVGAAKDMANDSVSYLSGSAGERYTTWFGVYTNTRWNKVSDNFDAIKDALDNKPKVFDCSCNQSYFAYVYPNQPYKVYLCRAFWNAPLTGTDSKGGTIIHEISHFNVVAGTDDVVYGQTGAKNLAISDPNAATNNADSHEYFAENKPNLN
jgi:peptidyl-Lys metalloendopeptidase